MGKVGFLPNLLKADADLVKYLPMGRSRSTRSRPAARNNAGLQLYPHVGEENAFPGFKFRSFTVRRGAQKEQAAFL